MVASHLDAVKTFRNQPDDRAFQAVAAPRRFQVEMLPAAETIVESSQTAVAAGRSLQTELPVAVAETAAAAFGLRNSGTDLVAVAAKVAADQKKQSSVADQSLQSSVVVQVADQTLQSFAAAGAVEVAAVQTLQSFAAVLSETIQSLPERRPVVVAVAADSIR